MISYQEATVAFLAGALRLTVVSSLLGPQTKLMSLSIPYHYLRNSS